MSTLCPVLVSYVSDVSVNGRKSRRQVLIEMLAEVEAYFDNGEIPNVVYKDVKSLFNDVLDKAYENIRHELYATCKYQDLPQSVKKFADLFGIIYLHSVPGLIKRAEKIDMDGQENHPFRVKLLALLKDVSPLTNIMAVLKDNVIKRQPKAPEEIKVGYQPPKVNTEAEKQVVALLEKVTEESYENLQIQLVQYFRTGHQLFLKAFAANNKLTPFDFFVGNRKIAPDYLLANIIEKILSSQHKDRIAVSFSDEARKIADEYRTFFVHKNFRKIASIVDGKKMKHTARELSHSVNLTGIEGTFFFHFLEDGSHFTVINKVVQSYSKYGKAFQRFPLTFTEVGLPDGKRLGRPSQERMNTVFLKG